MLSFPSRFLLALVLFAAPVCMVSCEDSAKNDGTATLAGQIVNMKILSDDSTFTRRGDGWFHISKTQSKVSFFTATVEPTGEKFPKISPGDSETFDDNDLPDEKQGEFYKLKLTREADGKVYLEERARYNTEDGNEANIEIRYEVEFTQGDWFAYEAGKPVSFQATKKGLETARDELGEQFKRELTPVMRTMLIENWKALKNEKGSENLTDEMIGRLAHVEVDIQIEQFPNTVYNFRDNRISYSQKNPTELWLWFWLGITTENLKE